MILQNITNYLPNNM